MKYFLILAAVATLFSARTITKERPELICVKNSKSKNTCYYNFMINGVEYQFMDIGCRYSREKIMEKVEAGTIALGKDWKVPC
ncbi:MAG TPA: hypothetical protein DIS90_02110 [Cytophagales bacterium]|nr:hypothetical protein [Cytophagales bacterium]